MAGKQNIKKKQAYNLAYGLGASIVIIGTLFKILHWEFGPFTGGNLLAIGLLTEAFIFALAAFEPVQEDAESWDWSKVYPELKGGSSSDANHNANGLLSKKLDAMLEEAKIDSGLMENLAKSIKSFEAAAEGIAPTADSIRATQKYSEELNKAASQMESLNELYQNQLNSAQTQANVQSTVAQNAEALQRQMEQLSNNLTSLNEIYKGMLTAMNRKSN